MTISSEPQIQRFEVNTDPSLVWAAVEQDSAAIVPGAFPPEVIQRFNEELQPQAENWENKALGGYKYSPHTKFINGLLSTSHAYRHDILNNPVMHDVLKAAFQETGDYWMVSAVLRLTQPGHPAQPWHRDANGWPLIKTQQPESPPLAITLIIPTTDFTKANGATRVFLGSHKWPSVDPDPDARPAVAELKPGDMLVLRQGVVHSGGLHTSEAPDTRGMMILSLASCQLTQYESALGVKRSLVESLTPLAQKMVGWRTVVPIGNVMGLNTFGSGLVEEKIGLQANQPLVD
jgi:verruculogen synthase